MPLLSRKHTVGDIIKRKINSKVYEVVSLKKFLANEFVGKTVGLCHGVFDVIHSGHIRHFQEAARLVDVLVVSITSDSNVNKGPGRPINNEDSRMETVAGIEFVDFVVKSDYISAKEIINFLQPNLYFKGKDYLDTNLSKDAILDNNLNVEEQAVKRHGGEIHFTTTELKSSSAIINAQINLSTKDSIVGKLRSYAHGDTVEDLLTKIGNLNISVIGEIIHDKYVYTESLGKSGKHPLIAEKELYHETFQGGILPLIKTYQTFLRAENIELISVHSTKALPDIFSGLDNLVIDESYKNIVKTRYINKKTNTYMYEKYEFDENYISSENETLILNSLKKLASDCDLLIALDFGHGLITPNIRDCITSNFKNLALNVQKNAGNKGFNNIGKYKSASVIVLNGEEVELELKQRGLILEDSIKIIQDRSGAKIVAITDGANGTVITNGLNTVRIPAINNGNIIDRTGAGDALFAIVSIFSQVTDDINLIGYLGNLAASINLNWFANKNTITKNDLIRFLNFSIK